MQQMVHIENICSSTMVRATCLKKRKKNLSVSVILQMLRLGAGELMGGGGSEQSSFCIMLWGRLVSFGRRALVQNVLEIYARLPGLAVARRAERHLCLQGALRDWRKKQHTTDPPRFPYWNFTDCPPLFCFYLFSRTRLLDFFLNLFWGGESWPGFLLLLYHGEK